MVNSDTNYQPLIIAENTMMDDDYEPVVINEQGESNNGDYENNEVVHEIFHTDLNLDLSNDLWRNYAIRYLIYCWSKLREQFKNCPDKKKKTLWQLVSERMVKHGFYFDAEACEAKWRSLKKVYMYNKTRTTKKDGTKHIIVWSHYYDMDRAIKGIPYEISDNDDLDDDDIDLRDDNCISSVRHYDGSCIAVDGKDDDKCHWTIDSTRELIRLYGKNRNKFLAVNQGGKHLLWEEIAQQLSHLGYQYSANLCNDKWRNLKMTYKKNKQRELKYGIQHVKWFYFKDIDNIFKSPLQEPQDLNDIITLTLTERNELIKMKKESEEHFNEDNIGFQIPNENNEINDNNDGEETLGTLETWTEAATKCLIELWGLYRTRFLIAAQGKKRLLWNEISEQLRQKGHNYSGIVCDRKWRLLKANYLKRKEKYKRLGVQSVKWQYYHDLDRLLGVPVENISWNMDSTMCLIDAFDHHKEKFMKAATGEKLTIWKQISDEMAQHGFNYSPRACDNKWRTLKNRYNKNRMRSNRNKKVIWVYYNKIDLVLKELNKEKNPKTTEVSNSDIQDPTNENSELYEHNYIRTRGDCSPKKEAIAELKDMFRLRNIEFDQRLKEMEDNLNNREKVFHDLQQQTLDALKKSNELEVHKLKLLEQLVSRLPHN